MVVSWATLTVSAVAFIVIADARQAAEVTICANGVTPPAVYDVAAVDAAAPWTDVIVCEASHGEREADLGKLAARACVRP